MEKKNIAAIIGATVITTGVAYSVTESRKTRKELEKFNKAVDDMAKGIDVDIPDAIVNTAMTKAAEREATKAAANVNKEAVSIISSRVKKEVENERQHISESVKTKIEEQISLVDINDVKKQVVDKATQSVAKEVISRVPVLGNQSNTASIIRACKDAGITSSYQIQNILQTAKEV